MVDKDGEKQKEISKSCFPTKLTELRITKHLNILGFILLNSYVGEKLFGMGLVGN